MTEWKQGIEKRLAGLALDPTREAEIVEELSQHVEDRYREFLAGGATREESSRRALDELSDTPLLGRELRRIEQQVNLEPVVLGTRRRNMIGDLWQDIRFGLRILRKSPGVTLVGVLSLTLGICAYSEIFR